MPESATTKPGFPARTVVVIPALNEESCVGDTVRRWLALGVGAVRVVDNGSTDRTASAARAAGAEVLTQAQRGYGAAAWRGLQDWPAGFDWVLFSSADGSDRLSPVEAAAWSAIVESGAELVIGDRVGLPSSRRQLKWIQRFGNRLTCEAIRIGWGRRFRDMGSLRLMRRDGLIALNLADRGFGWNVEMQVRAIEAGWKIVEPPVTYFPRESGESKISGSWAGTWRAGRGIVRMLALLWMLRWRRSEAGAAAAQRARNS